MAARSGAALPLSRHLLRSAEALGKGRATAAAAAAAAVFSCPPCPNPRGPAARRRWYSDHARVDPGATAGPSDHAQNKAPVASTAGTGTGTGTAAAPLTLPSFSLAGKTCVITGGAGGLGLVMGQGILESGGELAIVDLDVDEATRQADALLTEFRTAHPSTSSASKPPKVTAHRADVASAASVADCVAAVVRAHGKIDGLVTAAGFTENRPALDYPIERVRALWGVNVDGTYMFATEVARHLVGRGAGGSMVFIGSMSGVVVNVPQPQAPYNASKAAVRQLAASLAVEWVPAGIRVNCISPGYMLTPLTKKILADKPDLRARWTSLTPMGRMGDPADLKGPVAFLLSDASAYVTGADLRVDGGYTIT